MDSQKRKDMIKKERALQISFQKRKASLLKKAYELATLCGIELCIIIFDQKHANPETWPAESHKVRYVIEKYKQKEQQKGVSQIPDYSKTKLKKGIPKLTHLQKQTCAAKYHSWDDSINNYSEDELKLLLDQLDAKLKSASDKIKMLEGTNANCSESSLFFRNGDCLTDKQQSNILEVQPLDNQVLQEGYFGYPYLLPLNPNFYGNWPVNMLNENRNSTESAAAQNYDTQFHQLSVHSGQAQESWKWEDEMQSNDVNPWLSYVAPGMQMQHPFWQYAVMFGIPPEKLISQNNGSMDFLQMKNKDGRN